MESESKRKLAAIVFTDIVGFTKLSAENEPAALALLEKQRDLLKPIVDSHNGEWLKEIGDGLLLSFETNLDAVECAIKIQKQVKSVEYLNLRIGIHQGEVVFQGSDVIGDDVNIASRIEPFSASGGIAISGRVNAALERDPSYKTLYLGKPQLQGVSQEVKAYCIISHGLPETDLTQVKAKLVPIEKAGFKWNTLSILGVAASIIGVIALGFMGLSGLSADEDEIPSIAILYMKNLGNADDEPWAYGLTEDLIVEMSRLGNIRVASMNSVTKYKNSNLSEGDIAKELDVSFTLTSSIHKANENFNLRCQLQDHKKNMTLFGNKWTESIENASLIVGNLADSLSNKLTYKKSDHELISETYKADPVAYEYMLKGKYKVQHQQNSEDWKVAESLLKMSTDIDNKLASSWSLLGWISFRQGKFLEMREYSKKAIEIGTKTKNYISVGQGFEQYGFYYEYGKNNLDSAAAYYLKFYEISEKIDFKKGATDASRHLSNLLIKQGKKDEGLKYMNISVDMARKYGDKHDLPLVLPNYADLLLENGQLEKGKSILDEANELAIKYKKQEAIQLVAGMYSDYYRRIGDMDNAHKNTQLSYNIAENLNQELISFGAYVRMAESYYYRNQIDSTFHYLGKITTLTDQLRIPFMILLSNYYSGRYSYYNGDHKKSIMHFDFIIENIPPDFDLSMRVIPKAFNALNYHAIGQSEESDGYIALIQEELKEGSKFKEMEYYHVLVNAFLVNNKTDAAKQYILDAYDIIMEQSFKIKDRALRKAFLEKNHWNVKILEVYKKLDPA